jgi:hypothetical protein
MSATSKRCPIGAVLAALMGLVGFSRVANAQTIVTGTQSLRFDRPESWALAYTASETLLAGLGPPANIDVPSLRLGVEVSNLPELSESQRTVGFNGTKVEDLNKSPVLVRPRLTIGLPAQLTFVVGYVPPVSVGGARPNLASASLGRPLVDNGSFRLSVRAYGQLGSIKGDFTCSADDVAAGSDKTQNPFGCTERSSDQAVLRYFGFELGSAYRIHALAGLEPHAAVAINAMDLAFNVSAVYSGVYDTTKLNTHGATFSSTAGLGMPLGAGFHLDVDAFYSPLLVQRPGQGRTVDGLWNARALIEYAFF